MISISSNLNIMIKAAEKASKSVIRDCGEVEKLQVSKKGPYDFVTKTDKYVEKVLIEFNRDIVESLNNKSSDASQINSKTSNVINVMPESKELGFVGIPKRINTEIIKDLIKNNKIPVVAPLGLDEKNQVYNINGDTAAGAIAKSLKSRRLLLMTNVEGVLDNKKKLITEISSKKTLELIKNQTISGGMIPKINTCLDAVSNGVRGVVIMDGRKPHSILNEIFSDSGAGTLIR